MPEMFPSLLFGTPRQASEGMAVPTELNARGEEGASGSVLMMALSRISILPTLLATMILIACLEAGMTEV